MGADRGTLDALLKNVYLPGITSWVYNQRPLWDRIQKDTDKSRFAGRKYIMAAKTANTEAVGARAEGGTLPVPSNTTLVNMELQMAYHYATVKLSRQLISSADSNQGAFADAIDTEVTGAREALELDMARAAIFGTGDGMLGRITSGGVSGTTLTMQASPTTVSMPGVRYFKVGQVLDFFTALSAGSAHDSGVSVTAVDNVNNQITVSAAASIANSDYAFRTLARGNEITGLAGIVDDGTLKGTFQALSRTTYPQLQANVLSNSGTLRAWSPDLMDQGASQSQITGGGAWPTAIYSRLEIQRRAANAIRADRRFTMAEMELNNGYKALSWTTPGGTIPWIFDFFVRDNQVFFVNEKDLIRAVQEEIQWDNMDGSMWQRDAANRTHAYEADLFTFQNIGSRRCNCHTLVKDISHTL